MFQKTADSFRPGARTLRGEYFTSPRVFAAEADAIFGRLWTCVGRAADVARPGEYVLRSVAGESIIVVRGRDGAIRALLNVCRHRGTRLCSETAGRFTDSVIRCPYHAWTYTLEGELIGAPHMQEVASFDKADYPLDSVAAAEYGGFLFVNVDAAAQPFATWIAPLADRLDRFALARLESAHRAEYVVEANWKLVFENYSECLHCPVIHPGLAASVPYQSGANDLVDGPFLGGYMELAAGHESVTPTGRACGPPISGAASGDRRRAYYYSVMPNLLLSIHPDYVNYYVLTPVAVDRTRIESEWLFRRDGEDASLDPAAAVAFWDEVNRQDWHIIEQAQLGIASTRYRPGPYSPRESISAAWDREYLRLMDPDKITKTF